MLQDKTGLLVTFAALISVTIFATIYIGYNEENYKRENLREINNPFKLLTSLNDLNASVVNATTASRKPFGCEIRKMDPWDPQILPFNDPNWRPSCKKTQEQITQLIDGKIIVNSTGADGFSCQGRCLLNQDDWNYQKGGWQNADFKFDCDIVEVECGTSRNKRSKYNFLHSQIVERKDDTNYWTHPENLTDIPGRQTSSDSEKPNIFVIVFDSTSTSEFVRSMSRTLYLMKERHEAIIFENVNKVGINSRPNAWALMFGKQIYELGKNPYTEEIFPDNNLTINCKSANDNEDYWMHRFRNLGYHTMMADDWAIGAINWPDCKGFKRPAAKHYMKPFQRRNEERGARNLQNTIKKMCHETYEDTSLYMEQFMAAYKNESQIGFIWNSYLAHDHANGLYRSDDHFYRLLKRQEARLNDSFVLIMGDHGLRFGGIRQTEVGEIEDNNPFMMLSVPVKYRESNLVKVLKHNAKKLITHYDTYASFMHLAQLAKNNELDELLNPKPDVYKAGHGSSFFRSTMNEPRDCGTLRIPYEFCICEKRFEDKLESNANETQIMGEFALDYFYKMIEEQKMTSKCENMTVNPGDVLAEKLKHPDKEIYKLTITVRPSKGVFYGYVEVNRKNDDMDVSMMSKRFERVNSYGREGDCVKNFEDLRPICYCKNQKKG